MNDEFNKYKDIIQLMEALPRVETPSGITERVMDRLPELDQGIWSKIKMALSKPTEDGFNFGWVWKIFVSDNRECHFYFFVTGFFYLVMAMVLMTGLKAISSNILAMDWIKLQPYIALGNAMWLFALGSLVMMDRRMAIKMTQYGTLFYIFFTIMNGILMRPYVNIPYAGVFIICFVGTGACMGVMLTLAVQKMELRLEE